MDMNEVSKFEQKVGTLKLSDAIRIGAKMAPGETRGDGQFFDDEWTRKRCKGCCAVGAALLGACGSVSAAYDEWLYGAVGSTAFKVAEKFGLPPQWVMDNISDPYEFEGLSKYQVADRLESQGL